MAVSGRCGVSWYRDCAGHREGACAGFKAWVSNLTQWSTCWKRGSGLGKQPDGPGRPRFGRSRCCYGPPFTHSRVLNAIQQGKPTSAQREGSEQIRKTQDEPQWIVTQRLLSHLQYLDSVKSSAKDLSLPWFAIELVRDTFNGSSGSCATGPRPNACHVTMEVVDNTA